MLLAQTKRRVGIVQAVLRFSLALKGKRLVSPEEKRQKKKRYFFENTSVVEVKRFCVSVVFSSSFLGCCSLDPYWKHALVEKLTNAWLHFTDRVATQNLKEQTMNYRLSHSGVVLSCWHDFSAHSTFLLLTMIILVIVTIFKRIYLFFLIQKGTKLCFQQKCFQLTSLNVRNLAQHNSLVL